MQIQAIDIQKTYTNKLVAQKIRFLNAIAKLLEKIFKIFKKDFIYLNLKKKK